VQGDPFGGHDILVNNAGLRGGGRGHKLTEQPWGTMLGGDCNLSGACAVVHFDASLPPIGSILLRDARPATRPIVIYAHDATCSSVVQQIC
jgi:hypothetical protein